MPAVIERVDRLEDLMAQLLETTAQTSRELNEFKNEMREFKDEMREFKDEMREFKDEMHASALRSENEMQAFKDEMREFKDEIGKFQQNVRKDFGEVSNNMGRLVEDVVAPSIPKIFQNITQFDADDIEYQAIRCKKKKPTEREFDAVIVGRDYVLINETKSTLRPENIKNFHQLMRDKVRLYFPEYADKKFIGVMSSLYVDSSIITYGSRMGLFVLGFCEDLMDVLNADGFVPQYF